MSTIETKHGTIEGVQRLSGVLRSIGKRARALLLLRAFSISAAAILGSVAALILLDYLLRFPRPIRAIALIGVGFLVWRFFGRLVLPALRARFSPVDLALRIEHRDPSARGVLASAVELETLQPSDPIGAALRAATLERAVVRNASATPILKIDQTLKAITLLILLVILLAVPATNAPILTRIGVARTLTPWSNASWPKRFEINDRTPTAAHAIDEALPVRIRVAPSIADARATNRRRLSAVRSLLDAARIRACG